MAIAQKISDGVSRLDARAKDHGAHTNSAKALHPPGAKAISALRRSGGAKFDAIREGPPNS